MKMKMKNVLSVSKKAFNLKGSFSKANQTICLNNMKRNFKQKITKNKIKRTYMKQKRNKSQTVKSHLDMLPRENKKQKTKSGE